MNQKPAEVSDKITILIFKDNFAARTFQVPLRWISQFGTLFAIFSVLALASLFVAARYYVIASRGNPSHVRDLEQEVADLKFNIKALEANNSEGSGSKTPAKIVSPPSSQPILFSAFASTVSGNLPDPATLHFVIQNPEITWQQNTLSIRFALQYRASPPKAGSAEENEDGQASQQGRIMILARGPDTLLAYPSGVLGRVGSSNLLSPEEGESFSVSRFREVSADFGPVQSKDSIQDLEIYIFSKEGQQILAYQKLSAKDSE